MRVLACVLMMVLLCGCSKEDLINKFSSPEDRATALDYLTQIHNHQFAAVEHDIDPSLNSSGLEDMLKKMADLPPAGEPTSVKAVGSQVFEQPGAKSVNITFEYNFGGKWFIENLAVTNKNGAKTITGLHVIPENGSLEEQNKFTLVGKSILQYAFLVIATLGVLITIYSLVLCVRTKNLRRKWLWILFIIVGFGMVSLNWTSGAWNFNPLFLQLFSASAFSQLYGPWMISVSVPVGAIVFLFRRQRRRLNTEDMKEVLVTAEGAEER